jgi:aryl-alcohol dehydrogenase-like predicted oxidoreductase
MQYRVLGSTGLRVSVVGVGTWQFGGEWGRTYTQTEADAIFDAARDRGINLIDTAECYGDHTSEAFIGNAIARDRRNWVVATKFGHKFNAPFDRTTPRRPEDCRQQVEDSLRALRTDYIDILQYHSWGDDEFFKDDVLAELQRLKDQGKFRFLGNSVGSNSNVRQVSASKARGIEVIQIIYNRLDRAPEDTTFPHCIEQKLGVLARVPLASGYLSGKYQPGHRFDENEVRGKWHKPEDRDRTLKEVERIRATEVPAGVNMASWALAWCLKHPAVTCVIPGCKDAQQVRANADATDLIELVRADHPQAAPASI